MNMFVELHFIKVFGSIKREYARALYVIYEDKKIICC